LAKVWTKVVTRFFIGPRCTYYGFAVRYYTKMYKCLYDVLKTACNATASAIFSTYQLTQKNHWFATQNCTISKCSLFSALFSGIGLATKHKSGYQY